MVESPEQNSDDAKRALIAGAGGLLGRFMADRLEAAGWSVFAFPHAALDICEEKDVSARFAESRPDLVVNCAATTDVDRCERDRDWAHAVNVQGPRLLAQHCNSNGADLVHISTDYVFDGLKGTPYTQEDEPNPLSVYAETKLAGELVVREEAKRFYIVRSSWIFGLGGENFRSLVIEYARQGARLRAVTDQISIPTYAPDLAARICEVVGLRAHGLYHITNTGPTSWFDFARLALDLAGLGHLELEPVNREALKQVATRPRDTSMRCLVSENLGLPPLRHWRDALEDFVRQYETRAAAPDV